MDKSVFSSPVSLKHIRIQDKFWEKESELVRTEVIPYQWKALNDQIADAAPSYCMHNFKAAVKQKQERKEQGAAFEEPAYTFRGFECLPEDPQHPDDRFYGFVFQDSDFYKWIEAVGYSLIRHPDEKLEALADEAIEIVAAAQQEDGYLDTYYILNGKDRIFTNLKDHHELYCLGHLIEGAVAYYQATGKDRILKVACGYADYAAAHLGVEEGKRKGYPGHEIAEMALIRLYEVTGDKKYLDLCLFFLNQRGTQPYYFDSEKNDYAGTEAQDKGLRYMYYQAHLPVREQTEALGHAVRAVYLYSGMAAAAKVTQDAELLRACEALWDNVTNQKMYITGGIGATHIGEAFSFNYDLPNDTAYAETCASIGLIFWARRMLEIRADAKYANVMERALYNCVLSGMALDGKSFFYVNPLEVVPEACHKDERKAHVEPVRQKWFGCACCPPNLARLLSSVGSYAYTASGDTLFVHLYVGGTIKRKAQDREVTIQITSDFPAEGKVSVCVDSQGVPYTVAFRIPDWCETYTVSGAEEAGKRIQDGYLYLTKVWKPEEVLMLDFPMKVRILQANALVREDIGKVAVARGPMVYCMEEADNGKDLHLLTLDISGTPVTHRSKVAGEEVTAIILKGWRQESPVKSQGLYYPVQKPVTHYVDLRFVPYYVWGNRGENEMSVWIRQG